MNKISGFRGEYFYLSNFYNTTIVWDGLCYLNSESAFQSSKLEDRNRRIIFTKTTPIIAKRKGKVIPLRSDWEDIKYDMMYSIVKSKFEQNLVIQNKLLSTGNIYLEETNDWNDFYWGVCNGKGENNLGKILMRIREEIRKEVL